MAPHPAGTMASGLPTSFAVGAKKLAELYRQALGDGVIDADDERRLEELRKTLGLSRQLAAEVLDAMYARDAQAELRHCPHCGGELSSFR